MVGALNIWYEYLRNNLLVVKRKATALVRRVRNILTLDLSSYTLIGFIVLDLELSQNL